MEALLVAWTVTAPKRVDGPEGPSFVQVMSRIRNRARKVLENMFKSYTNALVDASVNAWAEQVPDIMDEAVFDCIDTLAPSAQRVVEIIVNDITTKSRGTSEPVDRPSMAFLEAYITRLEAPIAVQIWSTLFTFSRELLGAASTPVAKAQLYPVLRCLTMLCKSVSTTSALEDRRLRRELQEVYPKLLDAVVVNAVKTGEVYSWTRSQGKAPASSKAEVGGPDDATEERMEDVSETKRVPLTPALLFPFRICYPKPTGVPPRGRQGIFGVWAHLQLHRCSSFEAIPPRPRYTSHRPRDDQDPTSDQSVENSHRRRLQRLSLLHHRSRSIDTVEGARVYSH